MAASRSGGQGQPGEESVKLWEPRFSLEKLTTEDRMKHVLDHRTEVHSVMQIHADLVEAKIGSPPKPKPKAFEILNPGATSDFLPNYIKKLPSLNLSDMAPEESTPNYGKIELEMIEDVQPLIRIMMLGQDKLGDVVYVALYIDSPCVEDELLQDKLGFGCSITITHPVFKIALDGRRMIRVEDNNALFIHRDKDARKCRFCLKPNSTKRCGRCERAYYCSRDCQAKDWRVLKHMKICDAYRLGNEGLVGN